MRDKLDNYNATLDKMTEEFKAQKATREDNKEELDALEKKVQDIKTDIGKIIEEKEATKEEHFKQLYECELEELEFKHIEWMKRRKDKLQRDEEYRQKREEEAAAKRAALPNPYEDEISNCKYLSGYLQKINWDIEKKGREEETKEIQ